MYSPVALLSTFFLVSTAAAAPFVIRDSLITLPLSKHISLDGVNLPETDLTRANALRSHAEAKTAVNQPITNGATHYQAKVEIGSPPTTYSLLVDTGSSNTWVGDKQPYVPTSTSTKTSNTISISYGSGSMTGTEYLDQVSLGPGLTIPKQSIGVSNAASGLTSADGILGIGPVGLTVGTLSPDTTATVPTVTDNLFSQGAIPANEIGISFEPTTQLEATDGEITWGGVDSSKFTGEITYSPITATSPASNYWGVDGSAKYGTSADIMPLTAGIVDTGTTLVLMATDAFNRYQAATGGVRDEATGLLRLTPAQFSALQSLFFTIGGTTFEFTPNAQIWPRALNSAIGGAADGIYLIVSNVGANSGSGLDFILGQSFLERFYSVYDTANHRVGLATTPFTQATTN